MTNRFFSLFMTLILVSCATSESEPPPQPSSLRIVTLNTHIAIPDSPEFEPSEKAITAALNAMGAKVGNARIEQLKELIARGSVDIRQLVLDSVRNELGKPDAPIKIVASNGEADLQLYVEAYGLHKGLGGSVIPSIDLRASLVRADGTVIWDGHEYIDQRHEFREGVQKNTFGGYQKEPAQFQADFTTNIAKVVHELAQALKDDHVNGEISR